jgi:hypothetical protein
MKPIQQFQQGKERRRLKYAEFQAFFDGAESLFSEYIKRDYGISPPINVIIRPGGRNGGRDKRLVEIFFSSVAYEDIECEDRGLAKDASVKGPRTLLEAGPCLVYQRASTGDVFCILQPANTDESKVDEDSVILDIVTKPCKLNLLAQSHWRDLIAYKECTSINGSPSCFQRLRCAYLRHFRAYSRNQKYWPAKVPKWVGQLLVISSSFVLGGFITTTIEKRVFPDAKQASIASSESKNPITIINCQPMLLPKVSRKPSALEGKSAAP